VQKAVDFYETQFPDAPLDRPCVYFMALLERVPTQDTASFLERYPFSRKTGELLGRYRSTTWHALRELGAEGGGTASGAYRVLAGQPLEWVLFVLAKVDGALGQGRVRDFLVRDRFVRLEISGQDLTLAGMAPSPAIAAALSATRAAKIDGLVGGREQELSFALGAAGRNSHDEE